MKKNLLIFTILISMFSVINVSQANANCTAGDPCGTWAMLDSQGVVTNVIVCQASVCGGGTWDGQTVVPQVAPNPVTHDTTGTGSYIGSVEQGTEVRYHNETFFITENSNIDKGFIEIENETTTLSNVQIPVSSRSFTYQDTVGKMFGEVEMRPTTFNESLPTVLTVKQTNLINTINESASFYERKTTQEIEEVFVSNNLNLLLSKIQTLISLLGSWVK
jgi:hypothetical protein